MGSLTSLTGLQGCPSLRYPSVRAWSVGSGADTTLEVVVQESEMGGDVALPSPCASLYQLFWAQDDSFISWMAGASSGLAF